MPKYVAPGSYLRSVRTPSYRNRAIAAVETSVPAFFGTAPRTDAFILQPVALNDASQFERVFDDGTGVANHLARAVAGFFLNAGNGARCHVVNLGAGVGVLTATHLAAIDGEDEISLVAAPGFTDAVSHESLIGDCERRGDRIAVLDSADAGPHASGTAAGVVPPRRSPQGFAAAYVPWLMVAPASGGAPLPCPPSGHVCGIYARTDSTRGVHKPPANLGIRGTAGLERTLSSAEMQVLVPAGINPLRQFPSEPRVWGARTLAAPGSEYLYIAPRRLAIMIEQSIRRGTAWAAQEPNTMGLWSELRVSIEAFLHALMRQGAFPGRTAKECFYVRCDASTTTAQDVSARRAVVEVGFAPVRPAEFMALRIRVATA